MSQLPNRKTSPKRRRAGRPPKYPWGDWFRLAHHQKLVLVRGRDFNSMPHSMMQMTRAAALRHGLGVRVGLGIDRVTIQVTEGVPCPA